MSEESTEITMKALAKAQGAFYDYLEKDGFDPAHWSIKFTAYLLTADFGQRLARFEIEYELRGDEQ